MNAVKGYITDPAFWVAVVIVNIGVGVAASLLMSMTRG